MIVFEVFLSLIPKVSLFLLHFDRRKCRKNILTGWNYTSFNLIQIQTAVAKILIHFKHVKKIIVWCIYSSNQSRKIPGIKLYHLQNEYRLSRILYFLNSSSNIRILDSWYINLIDVSEISLTRIISNSSLAFEISSLSSSLTTSILSCEVSRRTMLMNNQF